MQPVEDEGAAELVPRYTVTLLPRTEERSLGPHAASPAAAAPEANGCPAADGAPARPMRRDGAGPGSAAGAREMASLQRSEASSPGAHSAPSAATSSANGAHAGLEASAGAGPAAAAGAREAGQHEAVMSGSPGHAAANGGSNLGISAPVCYGVHYAPDAACSSLYQGADAEPGAGAAAAAAAQQAQQPGCERGTGLGLQQAADAAKPPAASAMQQAGDARAAASASSSEAFSAGELAEAAAAARAFAAVEAAATGVPRFPSDDLPATSAVAKSKQNVSHAYISKFAISTYVCCTWGTKSEPLLLHLPTSGASLMFTDTSRHHYLYDSIVRYILPLHQVVPLYKAQMCCRCR